MEPWVATTTPYWLGQLKRWRMPPDTNATLQVLGRFQSGRRPPRCRRKVATPLSLAAADDCSRGQRNRCFAHLTSLQICLRLLSSIVRTNTPSPIFGSRRLARQEMEIKLDGARLRQHFALRACRRCRQPLIVNVPSIRFFGCVPEKRDVLIGTFNAPVPHRSAAFIPLHA
jgi:hypothetical protein